VSGTVVAINMSYWHFMVKSCCRHFWNVRQVYSLYIAAVLSIRIHTWL